MSASAKPQKSLGHGRFCRRRRAVLSACDAGLGKVAGGEGLLGLQRAFHTADVRTVVASTWKVDDLATRRLMEQFYANSWQEQMGMLEALREAQLMMLREGYERGMVRREQDSDQRRVPPYYWGAFVLSDDWR